MLGIYLQDYTNFTAALKGRYYHHLFRDENKHKDAQRVLRFQNPLIRLENIYKTPTVYLFTRYLNFWHRPFVAWLPPGLHGLFPRRAQMWGEKGTGIRGLQLGEGAPPVGNPESSLTCWQPCPSVSSFTVCEVRRVAYICDFPTFSLFFFFNSENFVQKKSYPRPWYIK